MAELCFKLVVGLIWASCILVAAYAVVGFLSA